MMASSVWNENINFVDCLTALCFTATIAVHAWEFVYNLSAAAAVITSNSHLFSVTVSVQCGTSWCGIL
jgi:hypothetical protein